MISTLRRREVTGKTVEQEFAGEKGFPYRALIATAIALGVLIRALHVLAADFPLNDGGMFYAMVRDIQAAGYRLPDFTSYNGLRIPFAYPPLAFFAAAIFDAITPLSLLDVFRVLPLVATALTVFAFSLLARAVLPSRGAAVAAVFAFSLLPSSFTWPIMGGGLTRSFGFLFAVLALHQIWVLYTSRSWRYVPLASLFCGLAVLSHLGTVPFLVYSILFFFVARGRHLHGLLSSAAVGLGTLVVSSPWWASILTRHGLDPLLAAKASGGSAFADYAAFRSFAMNLLNLGVGSTYEPLFPVVLTLALIGTLVSLSSGRFLVPAWWALILFTEHRATAQFVSLPIAILAGIGLVEGILPLLNRARASATSAPTASIPSENRAPKRLWGDGSSAWAPLLVLVFLVGYGTLTALAPIKKSPSALVGLGRVLQSLTPEERSAMRWVAQETSPSSQFLVVTGHGWEPKIVWSWGIRSGWADDRVSEWFPVLAERTSVATVQGTEWFPNDAFANSIHSYEAVQRCANWTSTCLDEWSARAGRPFTHVYIPKSPVAHRDPDFQCCQTLWASLKSNPRYEQVYDGAGAAIFARIR